MARSVAALPALLLGASLACAASSADHLPLDAEALQSTLAVERARPAAPRIERQAFLAEPALRDLQLSPDGHRLAWLQQHAHSASLYVQSNAGGPAQRLLADSDAEALQWSQDGRWLFLPSTDRLHALATAGQGGTRLLSALDGPRRRWSLGVDHSQPAALLLVEQPAERDAADARWRLLRVAADGSEAELHAEPRPIVDAMVDRVGQLLAVTVVADGAHVVQRRRTDGSWQPVLQCDALHYCSLLAVDSDGALWLQTDVGHDRQRLARLSDDGSLLHVHDDPAAIADLAQVVLDPLSQRPLIATYRSDAARTVAVDVDIRRHLERIERGLPGRIVDVMPGTGVDARWLVRERADTLHGARHHLYDPDTASLVEVLQALPFERNGQPAARLPEAALARRLPVTWTASDGKRLHGFLSVPPGRDPATLPLLVSVHGGPFAHDRPGFNGEAQLLANRGYLVFEPNFRGSTGHGRDYLFAADGDFGNGRVQADIVDGVRWLLAQRIGDPDRVAISGASFGGYAALLGISFEPALFRVALAAVPPTDFGWVIRDYARSDAEMRRGIPIAYSMRTLSLDPADPAVAERLRAASPIANTAGIEAPVVLLAAGRDERVAIRSITHYAARLAALDKDVTLLVDPDAKHSLDDPLTREAWFFLLEHVLHRRLGGAPATPPDAALQQHLQLLVKLAGEDALAARSAGITTAQRPGAGR